MKIIKAKVNWMRGFSSDPYFELLVDNIPDVRKMVYKVNPNDRNLLYSESDGYVSFMLLGKDGALGFPDTLLENGKKINTYGAWSSSSEYVNRMGFGPCIEVALTTLISSYVKGYTFHAGAITIKLARKVAKMYNVRLSKNGDEYIIKRKARK